MASIEQRGTTFRIVFRYGRRKFNRSLRTKDRKAADACLARLEDNLRRLELGLLEPPDGVDLPTFLLSDGRAPRRPAPQPGIRTLGGLLDGYLGGITPGSLEESTLVGMRIHVRRLKRVLGANLVLANFCLEDLQRFVDKRARDKGIHGRQLSSATIKKELRTLTSAWTWGLDCGTLSRPLPKKGLRFPKMTEKPPFQTWQEIERKIARGGLTKAEVADLWDCLFLTLPEIEELLEFVREHARQPFIYSNGINQVEAWPLGGPLPQLRTPTNTPGANVLVFVCIHSFEVLTHDGKGKKVTRRPDGTTERPRVAGWLRASVTARRSLPRFA
ncbi:MAG: hypothetical protein NTY19_09105 [Planctomycetota bacterium]|nr:hypothetical protein [Planctomycetota bacterium]